MASDNEYLDGSDTAAGDAPQGGPSPGGAQVMAFKFGFHDVRSVFREGRPWFVVADVCEVLEHSNPTMAVDALDEDEVALSIVEGDGGTREVNVVSESGLYALVLRSRKPQAKQFRRWVTGEVLPEIQKTGRYRGRRRPIAEGQLHPLGSMPVGDIPLTIMQFFEVMGCWSDFGAGPYDREYAEMGLRRWLMKNNRGNEAAYHPSVSPGAPRQMLYSRAALDDWWQSGAVSYTGGRRIR